MKIYNMKILLSIPQRHFKIYPPSVSLNIRRFRCDTTSNCKIVANSYVSEINGGPNNIPLQKIKDALQEKQLLL